MSDYYLGNGTKKPKLSDYRKVFGINAQMFYLVDKIRYETKREERKRYEETQRKAAEYAATLGWGILPPANTKKKEK